MATRKNDTRVSKKMAPRSLAISAKGIKTGADFASMMSALMSDMIEGRLNPGVGNAVCNAGAKLLKVVEMQHRYGQRVEGSTERLLALVPVIEGEAETVQ